MGDKEKLKALDEAIVAYVHTDSHKDIEVLQALFEMRSDMTWRVENLKEGHKDGDIV